MNERLLEIDSRLAEIKKSLEAKEGNIEELVKEADELRNEKNGFAVAEEERKQATQYNHQSQAWGIQASH